MKTFVNPMINQSIKNDPEGELWVKCIKIAQIFLVLLSFTIIHHITNPFNLSSDVLTVATASISAVECALVIIICSFLCITRRPKKEENNVKKYSHSSLHPSEYSVHPVYFI